LSKYISTGSERKPFYGAIQPRLGFSYALDSENRTTIFGVSGIYYDRSLFDVSVDETLKLTHPTYTISFADPDSTPTAGRFSGRTPISPPTGPYWTSWSVSSEFPRRG